MSAAKVCTKCGVEKELESFYREKSRSDGLTGWCRHCTNRRQAACDAANPHLYWAKNYRFRMRRNGLPAIVEHFTREDLIARWGAACFHCGGPFEELDHFPEPVALGGDHTLEGTRPSCRSCNLARAKGIHARMMPATHCEIEEIR